MTQYRRDLDLTTCCSNWKNGIRTVNGQYPDDNRDLKIVEGEGITITPVTAGIKVSIGASGDFTVNGDLVVNGDIIQEGAAYETHAEQVFTTDDYIIMRDGAMAALANGAFSGFQVKKYDGTNDGRLVIDNTGTARVGDVGDEQPLLTRDEAANLTNGEFFKWNSTDMRAETAAIPAPTAGVGIVVTGNEIKAKLKDENNSTIASNSVGTTNGRQYAVTPDANGNLSVNVPWTDSSTNQQATETNAEYPLLMKRTSSYTNIVGSVQYSNSPHPITANPSNGTISATAINAAIGSTTNNIGDDNHPLKLVNGVLTPIGTPISGAVPATLSGITINTGVLNAGDINLYSATQWGNLVHLNGYVSTTVSAGDYSNVLLGIPTPVDSTQSYIMIDASTEYKAVGRIRASSSGIFIGLNQNISMNGIFDIYYLTSS